MNQSPTDQEVIDFADAARRIPGGIAGVKQMAPGLAQECRQQLEMMRTALAAQDAGRLHLAAHSIKGSAVTFSASGVAHAALALEIMGRNADLGGAPSALEALDTELKRLERVLKREA